jgi:hypothetical protein
LISGGLFVTKAARFNVWPVLALEMRGFGLTHVIGTFRELKRVAISVCLTHVENR